MFSDDRPMHIARVRHNDIAGTQLGRHQRMHRGRGRMDPLQLLRSLDLFSAQRPRHRDVSVGDLFGHPVVVGKMYHFELRKILLQLLGKPLRRLPKSEMVMDRDEKFHEGSN